MHPKYSTQHTPCLFQNEDYSYLKTLFILLTLTTEKHKEFSNKCFGYSWLSGALDSGILTTWQFVFPFLRVWRRWWSTQPASLPGPRGVDFVVKIKTAILRSEHPTAVNYMRKVDAIRQLYRRWVLVLFYCYPHVFTSISNSKIKFDLLFCELGTYYNFTIYQCCGSGFGIRDWLPSLLAGSGIRNIFFRIRSTWPTKIISYFFTPLFGCGFWIRDPGSLSRDPG